LFSTRSTVARLKPVAATISFILTGPRIFMLVFAQYFGLAHLDNWQAALIGMSTDSILTAISQRDHLSNLSVTF
jgi:hypothetical protein